MKLFANPADRVQLERDVEIAMLAASSRFAITPDDAQQARSHLRILCKRSLLGQVMKTIRGSGKAEGESLSSFLEYYFDDQLPAHREPQSANRNPFEEELEEELEEEAEEDSRSPAVPARV